MKRLHKIFYVVVSCLLFLFSTTPVQAASCDLQVLTTTVQVGTSVQIQIVGAFGGISKSNSTFNLYSSSTGRWVDIGDQISDSGGSLTVLNDNDGNPLFIEGSNTVILRQAGLLGSQSDLCSGAVTVTTEPPPSPDIILCGACNPANTTVKCASGLSCVNNKCIPGATKGKDNAGCVTNDQCDAAAGYTCVGGDNYWCDTNPGSGSPLPGVCTKQQQTGTFSCNDRGGQCAGVVSKTCQGGTTKSQCQGCWINPVDPTGANWNTAMIGSCVIPDNTGCGTFGNYCCYETSNNSYSCKEGSTNIVNDVCKCKDTRKPLGGACTKDGDCQTGVCNGVCIVPQNNCISTGVSQQLCTAGNGVFCERKIPNTGNVIDYCCPNQGMCNQIAPSEGVAQFDGFCSKSGVNGIDTAIGCVPIDTLNSFERFFITWGLGIGGGFAILIFIYASFEIMTSSGDPAKLQNGKTLLISVISGIIMLALSIFILRVIGVNVLGLF